MRIDLNGTRLWFDVDGPGLVPDGERMRARPTVVLLHGGPGSYDHSYLKPHFDLLARHAQLIYLDLRGHGRSDHGNPADWSFDACADDVRALSDALGVSRPVVLGHSLGGIVAMRYGARHPDHASALVLQSTMARFDLGRLVGAVRAIAGDWVAELAERSYGGHPVAEHEWAAVFSAFGPNVPSSEELTRRVQNAALNEPGMDLLRRLDIRRELSAISCPVLVCVGDLDPITPVAAADEIVGALPAGVGRLEVIKGAGHFPWLDRPDHYWSLLASFIEAASDLR